MSKIVFEKWIYRIQEYSEFSFSDGEEYKYYRVQELREYSFLWYNQKKWKTCGEDKVYFFDVICVPYEFPTLKKAKNYINFLTSRTR